MSFELVFVGLTIELNVTDHLNTLAHKKTQFFSSIIKIKYIHRYVGTVVLIRYQDCPWLRGHQESSE